MVDRLRASLQAGHRAPLLCAPCGSGKTVMFCFFAQSAKQRGKRILILAHRSELLDQISQTLHSFNLRHGFIAPGRLHNREHVQVGSVFSVARRLQQMPKPDLIIIDEAHHAIARSTFGKVLQYWPQAYRIGVTATPQRLSGEPLSDMFDDLIVGPSVADLTELGALAPYKLFAPSTINTNDIHIRGGDYAKNELTKAADKPTITGDAVNHYLRIANGKRAIAFCCSIEHARHVSNQFNTQEIGSCSIDGNLAPEIRSGIIRDFREGRIKVLTSCDLISEGFDLPAIEVAILLRPTASLALHIQQWGRALRPYSGKAHAIILDHAGNTLRHGFPDDPREWTLEGRRNAKKISAPSVQIRTCPKCFAAMRSSIVKCIHCGYEFPIEARSIMTIEGRLEEVDRQAIWRQRMQEQGHGKTLEDLIALGKKRGYKQPWAWAHHIMKARETKLRTVA